MFKRGKSPISRCLKLLGLIISLGLLVGALLMPQHILASQTDGSDGWFPVTGQVRLTASHLPASELPSDAVYFCQRLVDRAMVQLLLPGAEHYSIWLPEEKIHRGVTAAGYGQPLYWVDEIYLDWKQPAMMPAYLSCSSIPQVDQACVKREIYREQDEGLFSLGNHCQHIVLAILTACGGEMPMVVPTVQNWSL